SLALFAELQAEGLAGRIVPVAVGLDERLVVGDGGLQIVGGIDAENRLDGVDQGLGVGRVAVGIDVLDGAFLVEHVPEFVVLGMHEGRNGEASPNSRHGSQQVAPIEPHQVTRNSYRSRERSSYHRSYVASTAVKQV